MSPAIDSQEMGDNALAMNQWIAFIMCMGLVACATKPPIQEMAEARLSVHIAEQQAQEFGSKPVALQSAERALQAAAQAIQHKQYEHARTEALKAKRHAQRAVRVLQKNKP
ncbi:MAG: DUF4398 domain-containing protein [Zetaproteobacteria bacterium]|nr:DUF4398 domain-containing protein [Zetaproteobacteria bacterium]